MTPDPTAAPTTNPAEIGSPLVVDDEPTTVSIFNEDSLRSAIVSVWGEHGAHVAVFDHMRALLSRSAAPTRPTREQAEAIKRVAAYVGAYDVFSDTSTVEKLRTIVTPAGQRHTLTLSDLRTVMALIGDDDA